MAEEDGVELFIVKREWLAIDVSLAKGDAWQAIGGDVQDVYAIIFEVRPLLTEPLQRLEPSAAEVQELTSGRDLTHETRARIKML
jgi:hypothetical protein